jgi:N-acetyltransferase
MQISDRPLLAAGPFRLRANHLADRELRCSQTGIDRILWVMAEIIRLEHPVLAGKHIRLEPLELRHVDGLVAAAAVDRSLYQWSPVPQGKAEAVSYVETALAWRDAGKALPFATVRLDDGAVIGSTRFFDLEFWAWPQGHARHGRSTPDACEIGYTWLTRPAIRTAANTEAKLLMLTHAFEVWEVLRVCLHTDARNVRSRAAIERIGGKLEGILRAHRMAADFIARDSARFSIVAAEWPEVKKRLSQMSDFRQ